MILNMRNGNRAATGLVCLGMLALAAPLGAGDLPKCSYKGITLKGKVQLVDSFPDIKVQIVESFPDIKVRKMSGFADDCGEWQFVDSFPDFTIQYVTSFPDVRVQYVDGFPERIAVFQTVFWEPRDTTSLRELIATTDLVRGKTVLEIGTGSGLVSLCC